MSRGARRVATASELIEAAGHPEVSQILVPDSLAELPTLRLAPGQSLSGQGSAALRFASGADGVRLSADNQVSGLALITDPARRALFNDAESDGFGVFELARLRVTGCVRLLAEGRAKGGHVDARDVVVEAADARGFDERPSGYGVEVVPGVFTLWNRQGDPQAIVSAELTGISAGRPGAPVGGGGVFVGGTPGGGRTVVTRLETGEIHSHGGIAAGTSDRISGGVFVVHGAHVGEVRNRGPVTTYGPNDMVLDNWGSVERWVAEAKITSLGPSGIGFVNFGDLGVLRIDALIETFGLGARGFNVYAGTVRDAEFERVVTRAAGAVGIQISQPVGRIAVRRGIETFGGVGASLVKGVVTELPAVPLSVKPGGSAREIIVDGGLASHGDGIEPFELHGRIETLRVSGGFGPSGRGFEAI